MYQHYPASARQYIRRKEQKEHTLTIMALAGNIIVWYVLIWIIAG